MTDETDSGPTAADRPRGEAALELEALRTALAESEALSAALAHELRSPVGAIAILGSLLARESAQALSEEGRAIVTRLTDCSRRMVLALDRLAVYDRAGQQELTPVPIDLRAEVESAFREQEPAGTGGKPGLLLGELPAVVADQALLHVLLASLLSNAIKCTAGQAEPRIEVSGTADGREVHLRVSDNGIGFDPAQAARLFRPFGRVHSQAELPGTGLGLALVQRIARRHGGRAWAEPSAGGGATFHVTLARDARQIVPAVRLAE